MEPLFKILIVDDSPDDRFLLGRALTKTELAIEPFEAEDGDEAIDFLSHSGRFGDPQRFPRPDLIFLDLKMPGQNGFDVLRWIQQQGREIPVKVVVLSGSELEADIRLSYELGAVAYLTKPATPSQLRELICSHVGEPNSNPMGTARVDH